MAGVAGQLGFYKNFANTCAFNNTTSPAVAGLDKFDTVDDYNNNGSFPTGNPWSATEAPGTTLSNWTQVGSTTTYRDEITGLTWTSDLGSTYNWDQAIQACYNSTAGGQTAGTWRLPSQKELLQASTDGIWGKKTQLSLIVNYYWSSSARSGGTTNAWNVELFDGNANDPAKTTALRVICLR